MAVTTKLLGDIDDNGSEWHRVMRGQKCLGHIERTEDYAPSEGSVFVAWRGHAFSDHSTFESALASFSSDPL